MECEELFCSSCKDSHETMKKLRNHCFVELTENMQKYISQFNCSKHNLCFEHLCIDDDMLCCVECLAISHRTCKITSVEVGSRNIKTSTAFQDFTDQIHLLFKIISERKTFILKIRNAVGNEVEYLKQKCSSISEEERICQEFHTCIDEMNIEAIASTVAELLELLNAQKVAFDIFSEQGSDKIILLFIHTSKFVLSDIRREIHDLDTKIKGDLKFSEKNISDQLKSTLLQEILDIPPKPLFSYISTAQFEITNPRCKLSSFSIPYEADFRQLKEYCIKGMVFTSKNSLLLCDLVSSSVLVWEEVGNTLSLISTVFTPWDIACIPNQTTAIVTSEDEDYIQFIDTDKKLMLLKIKIEGISGSGIDISDDYILVSSNKTIHVLNHEGSTLRTVNIEGVTNIIRHQLFHKGRIWISEYDSNVVYCTNMEGKVIFPYTSDCLLNPFHLRKDDQGYVYILGNGTDNIHIVSQTGKTVNVILDEDGLNSAVSFCFNRDFTKLFVSNRSGMSVLQYEVTHEISS